MSIPWGSGKVNLGAAGLAWSIPAVSDQRPGCFPVSQQKQNPSQGLSEVERQKGQALGLSQQASMSGWIVFQNESFTQSCGCKGCWEKEGR